MKRFTFLSIAVAIAAVSPVHARTENYVHSLNWMIVDGDQTSMSTTRDVDALEALKLEFGDKFLWVRQDEQRYIIRDPALMERALVAQRPVKEAGGLVGKLARESAAEALSGMDAQRDHERLSRKIAKLNAKIDRAGARGESAEDLKKERENLQRIVENMGDDRKATEHEAPKAKEHEARQRDANADLDRAMKNMKHEIRDILSEAKAKHLAVRVD